MANSIYVKECLGEGKKPIKIYKLRTMCLDADKRLDDVINGFFDSLGKPIDDFRFVWVGKFLRRYWIDELPQLYNLAKGDIKLVGVRPMREIDWKRYPAEIMEKALRQKPGLMGVQYAHQKTSNFEDHLSYLEAYLNSWEKNPEKTDREYLSRIVFNILFRGVRSS